MYIHTPKSACPKCVCSFTTWVSVSALLDVHIIMKSDVTFHRTCAPIKRHVTVRVCVCSCITFRPKSHERLPEFAATLGDDFSVADVEELKDV